MNGWKRARVILIWAALAVAIGAPIAAAATSEQLAWRGPVYILAGFAGQVSLGHAAFLAIGAYTAGYMQRHGVPFLIYLPLSFASGLFVPLNQLPALIQHLAPYLPSYHYAQLAWNALGAGREALWVSLLWLGGYNALFLALAIRSYRREERVKFA